MSSAQEDNQTIWPPSDCEHDPELAVSKVVGTVNLVSSCARSARTVSRAVQLLTHHPASRSPRTAPIWDPTT